jgi:GDSL-like Lipase/Acylhydrolase family
VNSSGDRRRRRRTGKIAIIVAGCLAALTLGVAVAPRARAADGTILRSITAQDYACGVGTGIAFDGQNLLLSCNDNNIITAVSTIDGSFVRTYTISGLSSIGALAWDRSGQRLWACGGFYGDDTAVYIITLSTGSAAQQFTGGPGCPDGLAYDGTDGTLWLSPDVSDTIYHYSTTGQQLASYPFTGACGNSGLAIGGPYLFAANDGCSEIYRAPRGDPTSMTLFGTFGARLEDMECDDITFRTDGKAAVWSKDAYDGVLNAFELNPGDCGFGGQPPAPDYVALGDSYSAGEGLSPYLSGTDTGDPLDRCHRSSDAYGPLLDDALGLADFTFVACSGAVTQDFLASNHAFSVEDAQVRALKDSTGLVTFTVGGNDAGFAEALDACVNIRFWHGGRYGCSKDKKLAKKISGRINALAGSGTATTPVGTTVVSIETLLLRIHQLAPSAEIEVAGYPLLFGTSKSHYTRSKAAPSGYACEVGTPTIGTATIDYADAQWLNSEGASLNAAIGTGVDAARARGVPVTYVDPTDEFSTHGLCDNSTSWINGLIMNGTSVKVESFHPTEAGQSEGYESAFSGLPHF